MTGSVLSKVMLSLFFTILRSLSGLFFLPEPSQRCILVDCESFSVTGPDGQPRTLSAVIVLGCDGHADEDGDKGDREANMESRTLLFKAIGRSHGYWGRKPLGELLDIFEGIGKGEIVLDPFCGGGTPVIAALMSGARVIAGDLNPMATFLTRVSIRPISIPALLNAFDDVKSKVASRILDTYRTRCPNCGAKTYFRELIWRGSGSGSEPYAGKISCHECGRCELAMLSRAEVKKQREESEMVPSSWFPRTRIRKGARRTVVGHYYELFSGRNLAMLSILNEAIDAVPADNCKDALRYVFTAMLYRCSNMQMFSNHDPSSSRGWTALRFYVPPVRKEANVWHAFQSRFETFLACREELNARLPSVRVAGAEGEFFHKGFDALVCTVDAETLIRAYGKHAQHVFLDPPYRDDIDYLAFSEFWGCWPRMKFDWQRDWRLPSSKSRNLHELLMLVSANTRPSCSVTLAFAPQNAQDWNIKEAIRSAHYSVKVGGVFLYDNSHKRMDMGKRPADVSAPRVGVVACRGGVKVPQLRDSFFTMTRTSSKRSLEEVPKESLDHLIDPEGLAQELAPYLRVVAFLCRRPGGGKPSAQRIASIAARLIPERLRRSLEQMGNKDTGTAVESPSANANAYHSLCLSLLQPILAKDGYGVSVASPSRLEVAAFGVEFAGKGVRECAASAWEATFVAEKNERRLLFYFDDDDPGLLARASLSVQKRDGNEFRTICVLIVRSARDMYKRRQVSEAEKWPRGFFISLDEIRTKCEEVCKAEYLRLCAPCDTTISESWQDPGISVFYAEVTENIPVGRARHPNHFKLRFRSPELESILPGQFVMMDTKVAAKPLLNAAVTWETIRQTFDPAPRAYLKRPFGIHRAFYPGLPPRYVRNLSLPPTLAMIMHTALPNEFEVFYKVLDQGIGTQELSRLREKEKIQMIGPLGKRFNIRELRSRGFEEVHVIGGGVGMAPLVFMVQALRFYAFKVKAFVGIESVDILKYRDRSAGSYDLAGGYVADPRDARIYVDDLLAAGLDSMDVFVSADRGEGPPRGVLPENFNVGLVSEQYEAYLRGRGHVTAVAAFTCGPMPMMKAIDRITREYGIKLRVLMEKRMACGIGVCLSCVCETKNGGTHYSRVCTDGPVFEASDIVWK